MKRPEVDEIIEWEGHHWILWKSVDKPEPKEWVALTVSYKGALEVGASPRLSLIR